MGYFGEQKIAPSAYSIFMLSDGITYTFSLQQEHRQNDTAMVVTGFVAARVPCVDQRCSLTFLLSQ